MPKFILASASPRRRELLSSLGVDFDIIVPSIDESNIGDLREPDKIATYLSYKKASEILKINKDSCIIAADTIVVCNNEIFGKPQNKQHFFKMFQHLNNNYHKVITGLTVLYKDYLYSDSITTNIKFKFVSDEELEKYWNSNEPKDKAGGYGIQGLGGRFVEQINGSFTNVVGLPIEKLKEVIDEVVAYEKNTC